MDPIVAYVKTQSTRDQLQIAGNILSGVLINNVAEMDAGQSEKLATAAATVMEVEQWLMTWQESLLPEIHNLQYRKPVKK